MSSVASVEPSSSRGSVRTSRRRRQRLAMATAEDRDLIYQLRHEVYARELGQHRENATCRLSDSLDGVNHYICLWENSSREPDRSTTGQAPPRRSPSLSPAVPSPGQECRPTAVPDPATLLGFVSITPPSAGTYSLDKYLDRASLPFECDSRVFEVRLLTVPRGRRGRAAAGLLMYAALRFVESHGGTRIVAIGRKEILRLYEKAGLKRTGRQLRSGRVTYELMHATVRELRHQATLSRRIVERFESTTDWQLGVPFDHQPHCFHGGTFFQAIGERFETLERADEIINADVLDAWFPPAPQVVEALTERLPWLLRTSPPTTATGFIQAVTETRGVPTHCILPGAGSSDLIFRTLPRWLSPGSRVLTLDPTYGEYGHVLERVIGCRVERFELCESESFRVDPDRLRKRVSDGYDLVVIVNPNSPTGQHLDAASLRTILASAPHRTRFWIDEAYVEYVGSGESLERFAVESENVLVCKSMSKVYSLSGARVAYLCGPRRLLQPLLAITPPWVLSLPAQIAAVVALGQTDYYSDRYAETHRLRARLADALIGLGFKVFPGRANFLLARLPKESAGALALSDACQREGLFVRDTSSMSDRLKDRFIRIAVKDAETNGKMIEILRRAVSSTRRR